MSLITYRSDFTVLADQDEVMEILEKKFMNLIKSIPYMKVVETTSKGTIIDISYRRRLSSFKDRLLVSTKRLEENVLEISAVGSAAEFVMTIAAIKEFPHTRIEVTATARSEKTKHVRSLLEDLSKRIGEFIRTGVKARRMEVMRKEAEVEEKEEEEPKAILVPIEELKKQETAPSKPVEKVEKPVETKPPTRPRQEFPIPIRREIEKKMRDPIWMAQLLMKTRLLHRKDIQLPSSPKELLDNTIIPNLDKAKEYNLVMISLRNPDMDAHIIIDPDTIDLIAAKTTIGGILDYTGEEALKKLFEKKGEKFQLKLWGITELPS